MIDKGKHNLLGVLIDAVDYDAAAHKVIEAEMRDPLGMPVLAVGAAFDNHAGRRNEPPHVVQRAGLQWLWRLMAEPRRLWRRYATTNRAFIAQVVRQRVGTLRRDPNSCSAPTGETGYA